MSWRYYNDYYDDDYDYDYHHYNMPDYSGIKRITKFMEDNMCCGLGITKVCDFLKTYAHKNKDDVAKMYMNAILAEYSSARAKYAAGSYAEKERRLGILGSLCNEWRKKYATLELLPDLEQRIKKVESSSKKQKKKQKEINKLKNTKRYVFEDPTKELRFSSECSGVRAASYVYYFEFPGCEQISFHSNIHIRIKSDNLHWDQKKDSTLIKLNYAVTKRYGDVIKKEFEIDDFTWKKYLERVEDIKTNGKNRLSNHTDTMLDVWKTEDIFDKKEDYIQKLEFSYLLGKKKIKDISKEFNSSIKKLIIYTKLCVSIHNVSQTLAECWKNYIANLADELYKDSYFQTEVVSNGTVLKFHNINVPLFRVGENSKFSENSANSCAEQIERVLFEQYAKDMFPDIYDALVKAEKDRLEAEERRKQAKIEAEERKKREQEEKRKEVMSYEYLTKSILKEYFFWTDTLIKKFAGEPDELKENPMYKCAEPMCLYLKSRIIEIEKKPEFVAELKKSYKRRHLEWNFENDIITH